MRHGRNLRKLGRTTAHRKALLRNLSTSFFEKERIATTLIKAKELRPFAERLITLARKDNLHSRRLAARSIQDRAVVRKLFDTLGPRFAQRNGGYSRILKLGWRQGDGAEMAILELLGSEPTFSKPERKGKKARKKTAAAAESGAAASSADTADAAAEQGAPEGKTDSGTARRRRGTGGGKRGSGAATRGKKKPGK
jgi:large subunit ribosomal protein L17